MLQHKRLGHACRDPARRCLVCLCERPYCAPANTQPELRLLSHVCRGEMHSMHKAQPPRTSLPPTVIVRVCGFGVAAGSAVVSVSARHCRRHLLRLQAAGALPS